MADDPSEPERGDLARLMALVFGENESASPPQLPQTAEEWLRVHGSAYERRELPQALLRAVDEWMNTLRATCRLSLASDEFFHFADLLDTEWPGVVSQPEHALLSLTILRARVADLVDEFARDEERRRTEQRRDGAAIVNSERKRDAQRRHDELFAAAAAIWKVNPTLSVPEVAGRVVRRRPELGLSASRAKTLLYERRKARSE